MFWEMIKHKTEKEFKRLTGVKMSVFEKMTSVVSESLSKHKRKRGKKRGRKAKLIVENQVLMLLMYYRENRTFAHIASAYQISESQCWRIITRIETILIKSGAFSLPGKKALRQKVNGSVLIDATETPIERPKKTTKVLFR